MKRILIYLFICLLTLPLSAQNDDSRKDKTFRFVYIAHDSSTPVGRLIDRLRHVRNDAMEGYEDVVFYLASGNNPIIVQYNVGDNNQSDFEDILLAELNDRNSHNVNAETDLTSIYKILSDVGFVNENKQLNYESASFNFYVSPRFFTLRNHEAIIAPIFVAFDIPNIRGGRVNFQLMESRDDRLPEGPLFGDKNWEGINEYTANGRVIY